MIDRGTEGKRGWSQSIITEKHSPKPPSAKSALRLPTDFDKLGKMEPLRPPTSFEEKVYDAVRLIPKGRITTYRDLGKYIGCRSAQAIGQALKRNPYAPDVPCHRVVSSSLTIGGFAGAREGEPIDRKRRLLESEGIEFSPEGHIHPKNCYRFDD